MEQLIAHLIGDYILQSDWMVNTKTTKSFACLLHCLTYAIPFLFITWSPLAIFVIISTHFVIDRFRLAKYVIYLKNLIAPFNEFTRTFPENPDFAKKEQWVHRLSWENCKATGYPSDTPAWLAVWLMIIADNTIHLLINFLAIKYL